MTTLRFIFLAVLVAETAAYRNGARPPGGMDMLQMQVICGSGGMRPLHRSNSTNLASMPLYGTPPYTLSVDNLQNRAFTYGPRSVVRVTLKANPGHSFKGFFITATPQDAAMGVKGVFAPARGSKGKPTNYCSNGLTNTDSSLKNSVTMQWRAPDHFTHGMVQFVAVVVKDFSTSYVGIKSPYVRADPSKPTESAYQKSQMSNGRGRGMSGGLGGLIGNLNIGEMMKNLMGNRNRGGTSGGRGATQGNPMQGLADMFRQG